MDEVVLLGLLAQTRAYNMDERHPMISVTDQGPIPQQCFFV